MCCYGTVRVNATILWTRFCVDCSQFLWKKNIEFLCSSQTSFTKTLFDSLTLTSCLSWEEAALAKLVLRFPVFAIVIRTHYCMVPLMIFVPFSQLKLSWLPVCVVVATLRYFGCNIVSVRLVNTWFEGKRTLLFQRCTVILLMLFALFVFISCLLFLLKMLLSFLTVCTAWNTRDTEVLCWNKPLIFKLIYRYDILSHGTEIVRLLWFLVQQLACSIFLMGKLLCINKYV